MKKEWPIKVLATVVVVGVALAVKFLFCAVPYWQSSEVYKKYKDVEGIRASYVKDFRVNDTLTVAVTLLEATDSAGWEYLLQAFNIPQEMIELEEIDVWTWKAFKNHPEEAYNLTVNDRQVEQSDLEIVSISMKNQDICVFHTQNEQEHNEVFNQKIESNF